MNAKIILSLGCVFLAGLVFFYFETGSYPISSIRVISGSEYDIILENGKRVDGVLVVDTPKNSSEIIDKVSDLFNKSKNPCMEYRRNKQKVEITLESNGKKINLSDWLIENKLTWKQAKSN